MSHVKNKLILWKCHAPVKGNSKIYCAKIRCKMTTGLRYIFNYKFSYFRRKRDKI